MNQEGVDRASAENFLKALGTDPISSAAALQNCCQLSNDQMKYVLSFHQSMVRGDEESLKRLTTFSLHQANMIEALLLVLKYHHGLLYAQDVRMRTMEQVIQELQQLRLGPADLAAVRRDHSALSVRDVPSFGSPPLENQASAPVVNQADAPMVNQPPMLVENAPMQNQAALPMENQPPSLLEHQPVAQPSKKRADAPKKSKKRAEPPEVDDALLELLRLFLHQYACRVDTDSGQANPIQLAVVKTFSELPQEAQRQIREKRTDVAPNDAMLIVHLRMLEAASYCWRRFDESPVLTEKFSEWLFLRLPSSIVVFVDPLPIAEMPFACTSTAAKLAVIPIKTLNAAYDEAGEPPHEEDFVQPDYTIAQRCQLNCFSDRKGDRLREGRPVVELQSKASRGQDLMRMPSTKPRTPNKPPAPSRKPKAPSKKPKAAPRKSKAARKRAKAPKRDASPIRSNDGMQCANCRIKASKQWRKGPNEATLCNPCGAYLYGNGVMRPERLWTRTVN